eukprot:jgi/Hompol1/1888/HPOL_005775-RA
MIALESDSINIEAELACDQAMPAPALETIVSIVAKPIATKSEQADAELPDNPADSTAEGNMDARAAMSVDALLQQEELDPQVQPQLQMSAVASESVTAEAATEAAADIEPISNIPETAEEPTPRRFPTTRTQASRPSRRDTAGDDRDKDHADRKESKLEPDELDEAAAKDKKQAAPVTIRDITTVATRIYSELGGTDDLSKNIHYMLHGKVSQLQCKRGILGFRGFRNSQEKAACIARLEDWTRDGLCVICELFGLNDTGNMDTLRKRIIGFLDDLRTAKQLDKRKAVHNDDARISASSESQGKKHHSSNTGPLQGASTPSSTRQRTLFEIFAEFRRGVLIHEAEKRIEAQIIREWGELPDEQLEALQRQFEQIPR